MEVHFKWGLIYLLNLKEKTCKLNCVINVQKFLNHSNAFLLKNLNEIKIKTKFSPLKYKLNLNKSFQMYFLF